MTDEAVKTVEHYIEGPRKPVLQEKQVFLVCFDRSWIWKLKEMMRSVNTFRYQFCIELNTMGIVCIYEFRPFCSSRQGGIGRLLLLLNV